MHNTPEDVLDSWFTLLNAGRLEDVMALYCEDAVLQPTFCSESLGTAEDIRAYFTRLSNKEDLKVTLKADSLVKQKLASDLHSLSGIYQWRISVDGSPEKFLARFTFIIDLSRDAPIVHHHSSQVPETIE